MAASYRPCAVCLPVGGVRCLEGRAAGEEARLGGAAVFRCMTLRENRYMLARSAFPEALGPLM